MRSLTSSEYLAQITQREGEVRSMFKSMDKVLSENRKLDLEFELMMASRLNYSELFSIDSQEAKEVQRDDGELHLESQLCQEELQSEKLTRQQWKELLVQTISRGHSSGYECAICMSDIIPGNRRVVLLSCSHLYHQRCILNLENFMKTEEVLSCLAPTNRF
jgi:hypothetical protein